MLKYDKKALREALLLRSRVWESLKEGITDFSFFEVRIHNIGLMAFAVGVLFFCIFIIKSGVMPVDYVFGLFMGVLAAFSFLYLYNIWLRR